MKLLKLLGQECAGALSFFDIHEYTIEESIELLTNSVFLNNTNYKEISKTELKEIIDASYKKPFLISSKKTSTTLCGSENKIPLAFFNNKWHLPSRPSPTTHIIKPSSKEIPSLSINEYICNYLARSLKIDVPDFSIMFLDDNPIFITQRFDRIIDKENKKIIKIHQESFSQALGIKSYTKYQKDGGPSIASSIALLKKVSANSEKDIERFCSIIVFNYLIGNTNAHGKNYSLLYSKYSKPVLSPFFDLVATSIYPSYSQKMSMSIGEEYNLSEIKKEHFLKEAKISKISPSLFFNEVIYIKDNIDKAFKGIENRLDLKNYKMVISSIKEMIYQRLNNLTS